MIRKSDSNRQRQLLVSLLNSTRLTLRSTLTSTSSRRQMCKRLGRINCNWRSPQRTNNKKEIPKESKVILLVSRIYLGRQEGAKKRRVKTDLEHSTAKVLRKGKPAPKASEASWKDQMENTAPRRPPIRWNCSIQKRPRK